MSRAFVLATTLLCGCVLAWQPTDSTGVKAGKLAARIPLGLVTLGTSEVVISREIAREEEWQAWAAKKARREQLTAEADKWKLAAVAAKSDSDRQLALTLFQAAREDLAALDAPQPLPAQTQMVLSAPAQPKNCNSQVLNGQVFTHCD